MDKSNLKLKILYKCIEAKTSAICTYYQLKYSSPNCSKKKKTRATQKSLPLRKWTFREKELSQENGPKAEKEKRIRHK